MGKLVKELTKKDYVHAASDTTTKKTCNLHSPVITRESSRSGHPPSPHFRFKASRKDNEITTKLTKAKGTTTDTDTAAAAAAVQQPAASSNAPRTDAVRSKQSVPAHTDDNIHCCC
ncbi:unnamed protein product [Ectocarpus sp. 12 AP-2014]